MLVKFGWVSPSEEGSIPDKIPPEMQYKLCNNAFLICYKAASVFEELFIFKLKYIDGAIIYNLEKVESHVLSSMKMVLAQHANIIVRHELGRSVHNPRW